MKTENFGVKLLKNGFSVVWSLLDSAEYQIFYGNTLCGAVNRYRVGDYMIDNTIDIPNMGLVKVLQDTMFEYSFTPINDREDSNFKVVLVDNENKWF